MDRTTKTDLHAAEGRGQELLKTEARARSVRYDRQRGGVVRKLENGCAYAFPAGLVEDLRHVGPADLSAVTADGAGFNLSWPALDIDVYVPALAGGFFGTRAWTTSELARVTGRDVTCKGRCRASKWSKGWPATEGGAPLTADT